MVMSRKISKVIVFIILMCCLSAAIHISGVKAIAASSDVNLASGKNVMVSSSLENDFWGKSKAVDGDKTTAGVGWTSDPHSTSPNKTEWISIDLGSTMDINNVYLYPSNSSGYAFPEDFTIQVSSDNTNWTTVVTKVGYERPSTMLPNIFAFGVQSARYIKIEATKLRGDQPNASSYRMQFSEVEIYNLTDTSTPTPTPDQMVQILNEKFDGSALDTSIWESSNGGAALTNGCIANSAANDLRFKTKIPADMTVEYDVQLGTVTGDSWVGMMFGKTNIGDTWDSGYKCPMLFIRGSGEWVLYNVANGIGAGTISGLTGRTVVHVKIETQGETIKVYYNDILMTTQEKSGLGSGYLSFYTNGSGTAYLDNIKVSILPTATTPEEAAANMVLTNPYIDSTSLILPKVDGFEISLLSSSNPSVISQSGVVTPPQEKTDVQVVLQIKKLYTDETITKAVTYTVPRKTSPEDTGFFLNEKYGLFVHYVWAGQRRIGQGGQPEEISASYSDGTSAKTIDEMIDNFDADQFAQDCKAFGMQYVIFTVWHYGMNPAYPSQVYKEWRTHETGDLPTDDGQHDLIDKIYQALNKQGIDLYLYTHPYDIHDLYQEDKDKFGYKYIGDLTFDYNLWNNYLNAQYKELCERYKGKIKGMFLDEGLANPANNLSVDYPRLRDTVKSVDPSLIMIQNEYNGKYTCDTSMWELPTAWHGGQYNDLSSWKTNTISIGTSIGNIYKGYSWWAVKNRGAGTDGLESAENAYLYTVLEAGTNTEGGGLAWAAGPYCGNDGTGIWEDGVKDTLVKVYGYIKPIEQSIKNTRPSKSYVTPQYSTINTVGWGVATESQDGSCTYLHIVNPPADGKMLHIAAPADGKVFMGAKLLASGEAVVIAQDANGITLTLPDSADWDKLNTVIELTTTDNRTITGYYADTNGTMLTTTTSVPYGTLEETAKNSLSTTGYAELSDNSFVPVTISWSFDSAYDASVAGEKTATGTITGDFTGGQIPSAITGKVIVNTEEVKSSENKILKITEPSGAVIKKNKIIASVTDKTSGVILSIQVSDKAEWKLYSDKKCSREVADNKLVLKLGQNKSYIKVTAEDGTSRIYALSILRSKSVRTDKTR